MAQTLQTRAPAAGLAETFDLLATTPNRAAVAVLLTALKEPDQRIRDRAAEALLRRHTPAGTLAVLKQLHTFSEAGLKRLEPHFVHMDEAVRSGLLTADRQTQENACTVIVRGAAFHLASLLVNCLLEGTPELRDRCAPTLLTLARQYRSLRHDPDAFPLDRAGRNLVLAREALQTALGRAAGHYGVHRRPEIIEAILVVDEGRALILVEAAGDPQDPLHEDLLTVLRTSQDPDVVTWLLTLMQLRRTPAGPLIQLLSVRDDVSFVRQLAENVGTLADPKLQRQFQLVTTLPWLALGHPALLELSGPEQAGAVMVVMQTGVPRHEKLNFLARVLDEGRPEGRSAAACALGQMEGPEAWALVTECLTDREEAVQLAATKIAIEHRVQGLESILSRQLNSPFASVREAARAGLGKYEFDQYLQTYEHLAPEEQRQAGPIVTRLNPQAADHLRTELRAEQEERRMRAVRLARSLGLTPRLKEELVELTRDPSARIRSFALRALEGVVSPEAAKALGTALADPDPRVRANAVETLAACQDRRLAGIFRLMARDRHNRVRANALLALAWLDEPEGVEGLGQMAVDPSERYRLSAAWALGQVLPDRGRPVLLRLAGGDPSHRVRAMAERSLNRPGGRPAPVRPEEAARHREEGRP